MQQLVLGMLLDDGGRGLARALAGLTTVLVLALFVVILVPIAVVADMGFAPLARTPGAEAVGVPVAVLIALHRMEIDNGVDAVPGADLDHPVRLDTGASLFLDHTDPAVASSLGTMRIHD